MWCLCKNVSEKVLHSWFGEDICSTGKLKQGITRQMENKKLYEDPNEMSKVLNIYFQKVSTIKFDFKKPQGQKRENDMWEIRMNREEIKEN